MDVLKAIQIHYFDKAMTAAMIYVHVNTSGHILQFHIFWFVVVEIYLNSQSRFLYTNSALIFVCCFGATFSA